MRRDQSTRSSPFANSDVVTCDHTLFLAVPRNSAEGCGNSGPIQGYSGVSFGSNVRFDTECQLYKLDVKGKSRSLFAPAVNPGREKFH
jgi:hypothetical protein